MPKVKFVFTLAFNKFFWVFVLKSIWRRCRLASGIRLCQKALNKTTLKASFSSYSLQHFFEYKTQWDFCEFSERWLGVVSNHYICSLHFFVYIIIHWVALYFSTFVSVLVSCGLRAKICFKKMMFKKWCSSFTPLFH